MSNSLELLLFNIPALGESAQGTPCAPEVCAAVPALPLTVYANVFLPVPLLCAPPPLPASCVFPSPPLPSSWLPLLLVLRGSQIWHADSMRLIYIPLSDTHCYRLCLLLLDAYCCRCYESCDCKLIDAKILKEYNVDNNGRLTATSEVDNNGYLTGEFISTSGEKKLNFLM
ncbi:hypothetical protein C0J52_00926 [Blattella germanica]|nr:hypothetical protein C0J52_00926 [Blattella germanica]